MTWLLLILGVVGFVELFLRLPILAATRRVAMLTGKSAHVITEKRISDHWKEVVLPMYSGQIFCETSRLALYLLLAASPVFISLFLAIILNLPLWALLISIKGVGVCCIVVAIYLIARRRFV